MQGSRDWDQIAGNAPTTSAAEHPLVGTTLFGLERGPYLRFVKPGLDYLGAFIALVLMAPLLLTIAIGIWLTMGRPVVLRQERMGRYNVPFRMYKFRTMDLDRRQEQAAFVGSDRRQTHKSSDDPRITGFGRWLRATRFDELLQVVNVLKGELSLVGPRPELVSIVRDEYEPWQYRRHAVKPGLTGLWQISDRGDQRLHECTEMELAYLEQVSLSTDLRIIFATLPAMMRKSGI